MSYLVGAGLTYMILMAILNYRIENQIQQIVDYSFELSEENLWKLEESLAVVWLVGGSICDVISTVALCIQLQRERADSRSTTSVNQMKPQAC